MTRFTSDSTEGYTGADLNKLNDAFEEVCRRGDLPTDSNYLGEGSLLDHIAETLLSAYDQGKRGEELITAGCQG